MCLKRKDLQKIAREEQVRFYRRFAQELVDYVSYLEHTAVPFGSSRYGQISARWEALSRAIGDALQDPVEAWSERLARFVFALFYEDPEITRFLSTQELAHRAEQRELQGQLDDCRQSHRQTVERLRAAEARLQVALNQERQLTSELEKIRQESARLEGLLYSREAHIRTQNDVIDKLRDELRQQRG